MPKVVPSKLPGNPPPSVVALWETLSDEQREALLPRLLGRSSPERLAEALKKSPLGFGVTTIKSYRRAIRQRSDSETSV